MFNNVRATEFVGLGDTGEKTHRIYEYVKDLVQASGIGTYHCTNKTLILKINLFVPVSNLFIYLG